MRLRRTRCVSTRRGSGGVSTDRLNGGTPTGASDRQSVQAKSQWSCYFLPRDCRGCVDEK